MNGSMEPALPDALQLHLNKVIEAIKTSREALEHKIETVLVDLNLLRADHKKVAERVKANESTLADLQPAVDANNDRITGLTERMEQIE